MSESFVITLSGVVIFIALRALCRDIWRDICNDREMEKRGEKSHL